jgi:organic hydroperoxide reductase OsmC/OhrA
MNETHNYEVNLQLEQNTKGTLSSPVLPSKIEVATPPGFQNGMAGIWSPEHLFVASVNACLMATFLAIASNSIYQLSKSRYQSY